MHFGLQLGLREGRRLDEANGLVDQVAALAPRDALDFGLNAPARSSLSLAVEKLVDSRGWKVRLVAESTLAKEDLVVGLELLGSALDHALAVDDRSVHGVEVFDDHDPVSRELDAGVLFRYTRLLIRKI